MTLIITTLSITALSITTISIRTLSRPALRVIMLSVAFFLLSCWVSLCWVPLCWMSWCWMSLCWVSWRHYKEVNRTYPSLLVRLPWFRSFCSCLSRNVLLKFAENLKNVFFYLLIKNQEFWFCLFFISFRMNFYHSFIIHWIVNQYEWMPQTN
jgi:hypothetical protein